MRTKGRRSADSKNRVRSTPFPSCLRHRVCRQHQAIPDVVANRNVWSTGILQATTFGRGGGRYLLLSQHGPCHASQLISQGNHRHVSMDMRGQLSEPLTEAGRLLPTPLQYCMRSVHEDSSLVLGVFKVAAHRQCIYLAMHLPPPAVEVPSSRKESHAEAPDP